VVLQGARGQGFGEHLPAVLPPFSTDHALTEENQRHGNAAVEPKRDGDVLCVRVQIPFRRDLVGTPTKQPVTPTQQHVTPTQQHGIADRRSDWSNAVTISQEKVTKSCGSVSDLSNAVTILQEKVASRCGSESDLSNPLTISQEKVTKSSNPLTIFREKVAYRCGSVVRFVKPFDDFARKSHKIVKRFDDFARKSHKIVKPFDDFARKSHKSIRRSAMLLGKSPFPSGMIVKLDGAGTPVRSNFHILNKYSGKEGREREIGTIGSLGRSVPSFQDELDFVVRNNSDVSILSFS